MTDVRPGALRSRAQRGAGRRLSVVFTTVRSMPDAEDVRRIALSLPDTSEKIAWGMPTFRVAGRMFATVPEDETSIAVRCPKEERDELVLAEPAKFWIADHEAGFAWVRARLAALDDESELRDILADSWRQAAPPRLLDAYPEVGLVRGE
ncbi:hypothetical protein OK074_6576 [Actinobacteria bacterium OK074]|nr:hypothetical protein OK074_6576 [Actinobacteria bacterium OK074]